MFVENEKLRFEGLKVYERTLDYSDLVFECTRDFPENENLLVTDFRNSSVSIALFIAEGSGKSRLDFISDLKYAKDAIRRCLVFTTIARRRNYLDEAKEEDLRVKVLEISKMLSGFIASLHNRKGNNRPHQDYHSSSLAEHGSDQPADINTDVHTDFGDYSTDTDHDEDFSKNTELQ
ncbi:MAG: four helix bundle protein [Bacteroidia bacterium]|nr:four helix bundle protein [Bacteroidia bacterium]